MPTREDSETSLPVLACNRRRAEEVDERIAEAYVSGVTQRVVAGVAKDLMADSTSESAALNGAV